MVVFVMMIARVLMARFVVVLMLMVSLRGRPRIVLLCPILFTREVLLAVDPDVDFRGGNAAADDPRNLQPCADAQGRNGLFQYSRRNSGVDEGAQEHVAAHAGKTLEIGNAHGIQIFTTEDTEDTESPEFALACVSSVISVSSVVKGFSRHETTELSS